MVLPILPNSPTPARTITRNFVSDILKGTVAPLLLLMEYQSLRQRLQSGRVAYDPVDLWECEDPEPENTPSNYTEVREAVGSLPQWAQVVCALTAAEMVLPLWEESEYAQSLLPVRFWELSNLTDADLQTEEVRMYFAPRRAIETTWRGLDGEATDVDGASHDVYAAVSAAVSDAYNPAYAAAWAAGTAADGRYPAADVASYAADAAAIDYRMPREDFYSWWWCNCKRRLAIMGLKEAELEWWQ